MVLLLLGKILTVTEIKAPIRIDGRLEEIWYKADSVSDFIQFHPYLGESPGVRTVVRALQDDENLYFGIRCYGQPTVCLSGNEDFVLVAIDPFGSRTTAYYFRVYASGCFEDGWILDDGMSMDDSWDGVWYRGVKILPDRFEVEIKIPFKAIRYRSGLDEWGVQFKRYVASTKEEDYWTKVEELHEYQVSRFGILSGVRPLATGYHFEIYPEGYVRVDRFYGERDRIKPSGSLNLRWDLTPQTTLTGTFYPDFAQIESDPFELNLTRYPTHFKERRPFFLEGKEIFRFSDFGRGFFQPVEIYYSRRIGRLIEGEPVPIIGGMKLTSKSPLVDLGLLGAYTDSLQIEPRRFFGVGRTRFKIFRNSSLGLLLSGMRRDGSDYNYAFGFDGVYRHGSNQFIIDQAISDRNGKTDLATTGGYYGMNGRLLSLAAFETIGDSFDVSEIGYLPWPGRKKFLAYSGPFLQFRRGLLKYLYSGPAVIIKKNPGEERWCRLLGCTISPILRNNTGGDLSYYYGPYFEADTEYTYRNLNLSIWTNQGNTHLSIWSNYTHVYNYRRNFLANQAGLGLFFRQSIIPPLSLELKSHLWFEWDPDQKLIETTSLIRPKLKFVLNATTSLSIFNESVLTTPEHEWKETELYSNRLGLLFAWNLRPKSWFYIALNDYHSKEDRYQISAVKLKYLIYF